MSTPETTPAKEPRFWAWLYWFVGMGRPLNPLNPAMYVEVRTPSVRRLIAQSLRIERRERYGRVAWTYSRDRVVERRELRCESLELKAARLERAYRDRYPLRNVA